MTAAGKTRLIAVLGSSMNPPTVAHFNAGAAVGAALHADEVDMVFSVNRFKDPEKYEPITHRMAMGEILRARHPDTPFVLSDIEERINSHVTWDVLNALQSEKPDCRLVWVMGADNLIDFHTWENAEDIVSHFSIAVIDRPGYTETAIASPTASQFAHLRVNTAEDLVSAPSPCWALLPALKSGAFISSSGFLKQLREGQRAFNDGMQEIADYILDRGLYGMPRKPPPPTPDSTKLMP